MPPLRTQLLAICVSLALLAGLFTARWLAGITLADPPIVLIFVIPVIVGAYIGGLWPGLMATAIVSVLVDVLVLPPTGLGIAARIDVVRWITLIAIGVLISAMSEALHRSRRRLLAEQSLLSVTLTSIGDAVITTNPQGMVTLLNGIAENLTGWRAADAVGRPLTDVLKLFDIHTRQPLEDPVTKVLRTGIATGLANHALLIAKDGRETPIDDSCAPIRHGDGPLQGVVLVFRDCSQRYHSEKALADRLAIQEQLQRIHDIAPVVLHEFVQGTDGTVRMPFCGSRIEQIFGYTAEELAKDASVLFNRYHPDDIPRVLHGIQESAKNLTPFRDEFRVIHPQHGEIWVEGHAVANRSPDGSTRWYGYVSDITDRRRTDQAQLRWADAFEYCTHGIAIGDPRTARIVVCNPAYAKLHGRTVDEVVGMAILDIYAPSERDNVKSLIAESDRLGKIQFETHMLHKNGQAVPVQMDVVSVQDSIGQVRYRVATAQDITVRRAAEAAVRQSESRLRSVIELLGEGLVICDLQGELLHWNRAAMDMHGFADLDELKRNLQVFTQLFDLATPDGRSLPLEEWPVSRILRGETLRAVEIHISRRDKPWERIYHYGGALVRDASGTALVAMVTMIDVTAEKHALNSLRQAKDAAEAASHAKDQFLAVLSHELRTPLTPVLLVASAMEADPALPDAFREDISVICANTQAEARLIDDLLDLTRITHGKFSLELAEIDLHEQIRRAISICQEEVQSRRQTLQIELSAARTRIQGDPQRIQQVMWNLLQNASKYTPADGILVIRTYNQPRNARQGVMAEDSYVVVDFSPQSEPSREVIIVEVEDSGMGIAAESLSRIFDPFEQPHRTLQNGVGGIGLGLTITRAIVEAHHAAMIVHSPGRGRGSKFILEFVTELTEPAVAVSATAPEQPPVGKSNDHTAQHRKPAMRLLLVEDHFVTARNLQRLLQSEGYEVTMASNLADAKQAIGSGTFEVLLTDLGLPDGDGSELMAMLRERDAFTRGIVLSGYGMETDLDRTRRAGFDAHLIKPITADELFAAIEKFRPESLQ